MMVIKGVMGRAFLGVLLVGAVAGCTQPRYAYHTSYELKGCTQPLTRDIAVRALVRAGYFHSAETKGPLDIYHKPEIEKKGPLAQEPYEDKAGDFAVALCTSNKGTFLVAEEWTACKDRKDCTAQDQRDLRKLAEGWGCQVTERSGHSEGWKLDERQDWVADSCASIVSQLTF
jgi:hypothetical protein